MILRAYLAGAAALSVWIAARWVAAVGRSQDAAIAAVARRAAEGGR